MKTVISTLSSPLDEYYVEKFNCKKIGEYTYITSESEKAVINCLYGNGVSCVVSKLNNECLSMIDNF